MCALKRKILRVSQLRTYGVLTEKFYLNSFVRFKRPESELWNVGRVYFEPKDGRQVDRDFTPRWSLRQPQHLLGSELQLQGHLGRVRLKSLETREPIEEETLGDTQFKDCPFPPDTEVQFTVDGVNYNGIVESLKPGDIALVIFFDTLGNTHRVSIGYENLNVRDNSQLWIRRLLLGFVTFSAYLVWYKLILPQQIEQKKEKVQVIRLKNQSLVVEGTKCGKCGESLVELPQPSYPKIICAVCEDYTDPFWSIQRCELCKLSICAPCISYLCSMGNNEMREKRSETQESLPA